MTNVRLAIVVAVTQKGGKPREERFDKAEVTVGGGAGVDIVCAGTSKFHCRVVQRDGKLIIVDLKSDSGTYVNGKRISSPQVLRDNDKVYVGDWTLTLSIARTFLPERKPTVLVFMMSDREILEVAAPKLGATLTIGRDPTCDVHLDNRALSRRHTAFSWRGETLYVVDLNSQGGTYQDGNRITTETAVAVGNVVELGRYQIEISDRELTPKRAPASPPSSSSFPEPPPTPVVAAPLVRPLGTTKPVVVDDDVDPIPPGRR